MALSPIAYGVEDAATETTEETIVTKTYSLDMDNGTIGKMIDGRESLEQFIVKAIKTARGRYLIYDDDYGSEIENLIETEVSFDLVVTEIPRLITEALVYDDRISNVDNFIITQDGDTVNVEFTVTSVIGAFEMGVTM